ncbi:helix-turn-helix domain-containing protein [Lentzea flava]|uniref:HTH cro/C1-type domain-containing protein n=1 Tax=Lentzea flava TaxID=103732 RepID=A0ABQ2UCE3_9PSEU|nr:helix-turn-helix transcriptional regulator [Lentzea flava]MCP2196876.1 Helix-turn-helix domain-containing protein [Lentzea flava]GGU14847.1 hypothetical protein GCM10010178_02900 [Lentzea flava]
MPRPEKPLDPFAGPVEQFAFDLRKLREKAGSPGYRELGKLSHYSPSTLADAARGQRLPSLAVTLAFVRACGGDEEEWERRWREIGAQDTDQPRTPSPYVGLKAFTEQDADRFFGRERLVGKLLGKLEHHDTVLVIGASGSGKSSLLRAGLLARVHGELITPGTHQIPQTEALLVVDQFEEIFTLPTATSSSPNSRAASTRPSSACAPTSTATSPATPPSPTPSRTRRSWSAR